MEENKNALDEVNKGCSMGIEAIDNLIEKVDSKELIEEMDKEKTTYQDISIKINDIYDNYSDKSPHELNTTSKMMTDYMLTTKTLINHSDSKIAEILLQGTNMGIIEGRRIMNNKNLKKDVNSILKEFINHQEKAVESLKKFL